MPFNPPRHSPVDHNRAVGFGAQHLFNAHAAGNSLPLVGAGHRQGGGGGIGAPAPGVYDRYRLNAVGRVAAARINELAVTQPFVLAVAVIVAGSEHELAVIQVDVCKVLAALAVGMLHGGSPGAPGACADNAQIPTNVDDGVADAVLLENGQGVFGRHAGQKSAEIELHGGVGADQHAVFEAQVGHGGWRVNALTDFNTIGRGTGWQGIRVKAPQGKQPAHGGVEQPAALLFKPGGALHDAAGMPADLNGPAGGNGRVDIAQHARLPC